MRRRVLRVAIGAVLLTIAVLGLPAAYAVARIVSAEAHGELQRAALSAALDVSPAFRFGDPVELGRPPGGVSVAVYDVLGRRVSGVGPAKLDTTSMTARNGTSIAHTVGSDLVQIVPVGGRERVIALVRAARATADLTSRTLAWCGLLAIGCVAAGSLASLFAGS